MSGACPRVRHTDTPQGCRIHASEIAIVKATSIAVVRPLTSLSSLDPQPLLLLSPIVVAEDIYNLIPFLLGKVGYGL